MWRDKRICEFYNENSSLTDYSPLTSHRGNHTEAIISSDPSGISARISSVVVDANHLISTSCMSSIHKIIHKLSASWQEAEGLAARGSV